MSSACRSGLSKPGVALVVGLLGVSLVILALPACSQQHQQAMPQMGVRSGTPVLHAVYAQEIRDAMHQLDTLASNQLYLQIYTGSPQVDMAQVATAAEKMADVAANRLPKLVRSDQLQPDELVIYNDLARRLHDQAAMLKQQADRNELTSAQATTNQIIETCNTCHTMFRGVAGPIK